MQVNGVSQPSLTDIEELASQKEREWQSVATLHIKSLQEALGLKTHQYDELNNKFFELKEDFKYNLKLLHERDKELEDLDGVHQKLKVSESKFLAEISDLHIKVDNCKEKVCQEKKARDELEIHYKQRLIDQQTQLEIFRTSKNNEVEETISELRRMKQKFEHKIAQLECELESQKIDLVHEFEDLMKSRERELVEKEEKNRNKCMVLEMKNKLLSKELEYCREKEDERTGANQAVKERNELLQNKLQQAEWDVSDISSLKNARILELEAQVTHLQSASQKIEEEYEKRRIQLDKDIRCKQANLMAAKQANLDREKSFDEKIRNLQSQLETSKLETNRALWDGNDTKKKFEFEMQQQLSEIEELKERLETTIINQSKSVVAKDTEIITLKRHEEILKKENQIFKTDIAKYQKDLSKSIQREEELTQSKAQLKLDWKQRCATLESAAFNKSENLATNLMKTREVAVAEATKLRHDLEELKVIYESASHDRDVAFTVLQKHHLSSEFERLVHEHNREKSHSLAISSSQCMQDLRYQNDQLKLIIKQMTADMQELHEERKKPGIEFDIVDVHREKKTEIDDKDPYCKSLENELLEQKKEKRRLEEEVEKLKDSNRQQVIVVDESTNKQSDVSTNHPTICDHINKLNKTIGTLEAEKIDLRARLQKLQANLDHQMAIAQRYQHESKESSSKIQQLEYEATAVKHRRDHEIKQLKDQISSMSLQLTEAQREADEYYRGGIKNNMRAMELSGKISQMTVDIASNTPWVSNHVQAKLMQDLQTEITELRKKLAHARQQIVMSPSTSDLGGGVVLCLQNKLKVAGDRIRNLIHERNMLLESGNKMRAQLINLKQDTVPTKDCENTEIDETAKNEGKLQKMEELQYQLTKQELAFAQRQAQHTTESSSSSSVDDLTHMTSSTTGDAKQGLMLYSLSSVGDSSMKEVWKMLDQASSSPSVAGDDHPLTNIPTAQVGIKPTSSRTTRHNKSVKKKKAANVKIRNYNVKDDLHFRTDRNSMHK